MTKCWDVKSHYPKFSRMHQSLDVVFAPEHCGKLKMGENPVQIIGVATWCQSEESLKMHTEGTVPRAPKHRSSLGIQARLL